MRRLCSPSQVVAALVHNARMTRRAEGESPVARQILLLQVAVVVVLVVTAVALASLDARRDSRESARMQAAAVARSVADSPFVRREVGRADPPRGSSRSPRRSGATPAPTSWW